ncbi:MAG: hypothetical protein NZ899_04420 [Thermoguttaceae bacterium]|nr:hypothetical protein [Thermoguttaceae bacterium]MDW8077830.1 hypothetical protein [Thermoguttaceae bacterium]
MVRMSQRPVVMIPVLFGAICFLPGVFAQLPEQGQVELELILEPGAPPTAMHEWARTLTQLGLPSVRATTGDRSQRPMIEEVATPTGTRYRVYAVIDLRGDLRLPGGRRVTIGQASRLVAWLEELARSGPEEKRPKVDRFGLTADELLRLRQQLALAVGFPTKGRPRREVLEEVLKKSPVEVIDPAGHIARIDPQDKVNEELSHMSTGTAVAYLLRPPGLAIVPTKKVNAAGSRAVIEVVRGSEAKEIWPIGWPAIKPAPDLVPQLYQFLEVNVQGVSAGRVVDAVAQRTGLPVLWDYNAMARWGIDPDKGSVRFPPKSTSYAQLLRHCLFQAGLKYELRVDEADKPFLWITTLKPLE